MAAHLRTQIRNAVATALAGLTTTGARVYKSRTRQMQPEETPALLIYTKAEAVGFDTQRGKQVRVLQLAVEAYARATDSDTCDVQLDQMALEVEAALAAVDTLGGLVQQVQLASIEAMLSGEGDRTVGVAQMTFEVRYRTQAGVPDTPA